MSTDAKRGKIFTRCIHEITVAVREGKSGDPNFNPRLKLAIANAKSQNMPNNNIDRAIKRAEGADADAAQHQELTYEGYGPGGTAVLVETLTDNKNRTVGEVRHAFSKCGGSLGENGCVSYLFNKKGLFVLAKDAFGEEELMELALDAGAEDVADEGDVWEVTCESNVFHQVQEALAAKTTPELAEVQMLPMSRIMVEGKEAQQMIRLVDMLEDLDDVMNVFTNCDFADDIEAE